VNFSGTTNYGRNSNAFFAEPGYFPRNLDQSFPLSPIATRFYAHGTPEVFSFLPLWLASLIESIWAYVLAFVVIGYPIYKLIIAARYFPAEHLMNEMFINLRELDEEISAATSKDQLITIIQTIEDYRKEVNSSWLFGKNSRLYFNLKNALIAVQRDADKKMQEIS